MNEKKSVEIQVAQQKLTLRTEGDPSHVINCAELVNRKLAEVLPFGHPVSQQVLILAAMNLADDLLRQQESAKNFKAQVAEKSAAVLTRLDKEFPLT